MKPRTLLLFFILISFSSSAQQLGSLTVEKIMRDPKWMGSSPSDPFWNYNGSRLFFKWNPDTAPDDSLYYITPANNIPVKATVEEKQQLISAGDLSYNSSRTAYVYDFRGDIYYTTVKDNKTRQVTNTVGYESNPAFSFNDTRIVYSFDQNLYAWDLLTGETQQLTNIKSGESPGNTAGPAAFRRGNANPERTSVKGDDQEEWLKKDQLLYLEVLKSRKQKRDETNEYNKKTKPEELRSISIADKFISGLTISPDGRFISYRLTKRAANTKSTIVPNYVTETGFTTDLPGRTKVGAPMSSSEFYLYDREKDTIMPFPVDKIPGIKDLPDYLKDYPQELEAKTKKPANRDVNVSGIYWSPKGKNAIIEIRAQDNKDRWLMLFDPSTGNISLANRQRDEAWIGGPGTWFGNIGWVDEQTCWFQSEATGYSHLYTYQVGTGTTRALTSGNYEVQSAKLSNDKKYFYITTNAVHPGEKQFYRLTIADGKQERITTMTGANTVEVSPDEKLIAILYSYTNKPWELYLQENKPGGKISQITDKAQSDEFKSYPWKDPEVMSFTARDGATVYARIYKPVNPAPGKPAVLFVHGAGYLQNAHKWWSSYFREYMFNNMLADNGYYVMDIDYRASAGYGRDWRTAIYRHMGGKDLDDNVDAVHYLEKTYGVDPKRVGLYGGSYGGFITLMAMFTAPDVFTSGAALRPVTDWANYNHGYTSNILNEPFTDSIAYHQSSPIYFADGLKGNLLICHGMIDVNVHFQDAVKLTQRLIELGKDNWQLAPFPLEDHGFVEPSSWTDEYKRIFKLFETTLKK